jgi:Ca-activated chloride channel family protein
MSRTSSVPRTLLRALAGMALATALIGCGPSTHPEVAKPSDAERLDGYTAMETGYTDPEFNGQFNTEEYSSVNEAGFVSTLARPLSTVSADVDTASYANLRRMINDGSNAAEIPSGAVRIEEMLNYFDYAYPAPTGDDLFSITAQLAPCPWNPDTQLLSLGFATSPEATSVAEAGSNLVFLVDVSGSMESRDKLDLLKEAFEKLVDKLDDNDTVSIVTYASGEEIVLEGAKGSDHREILRAIKRLKASGSTNGEAGLAQAYEVAARHYIQGGVNRIVMASDGDLNVGMSSESELHDYVDRQRETGIYLSVLGFGSGNYKDNKMETLADHGNGSYHYIDSVAEAQRVLADKLMANLVPLADDAKVQVEFNPAQVKGYRLIGYENRALADEDFKDDSKDAGDVGPGQQFTVAYEIVLADSPLDVPVPDLKYGSEAPASSSSEWLTAKLRYQPADGSATREQQVVVDASTLTNDPSADWRWQAAVIEFGMLLRDSAHKGSATWQSARELAKGATQDDELRVEMLDLIDLAAHDPAPIEE